MQQSSDLLLQELFPKGPREFLPFPEWKTAVSLHSLYVYSNSPEWSPSLRNLSMYDPSFDSLCESSIPSTQPGGFWQRSKLKIKNIIRNTVSPSLGLFETVLSLWISSKLIGLGVADPFSQNIIFVEQHKRVPKIHRQCAAARAFPPVNKKSKISLWGQGLCKSHPSSRRNT